MVFKSLSLTIAAALVIAGIVQALRPEYRGVRAGRPDENYLSSKACVSCHAGHYESWARTYHSRMTQEADTDAVLGDFETHNTFEYLGVKARMEKRAGGFLMTLSFPDGRVQSFTIDRTVGSRRMQQYLTKNAGQYIRLPVAYDLVNRRWISLNGSFFYPDGQDYFQHKAEWDPNCVFCHNVKAQPNFNFSTRQFNTEVAELGVACGACHGQSAEHAERGASPLTRTLWRVAKDEPKQIVNPLAVAPERSVMICGHCHGQRVPEPLTRIQEILSKGDPYNSGDDLSSFYRPVTRETRVGDFSFANRFWSNGSPRLTAYEYQGLLRSRCFTEGDGASRINCLTCHTMHGGDPKGQITEENRTDKPCLTCHTEFSSAPALASHTKHAAQSTGSRCYNCHMPRVVFGIMSVHPTHEITVPDPQLTAAGRVPNACNQCHLERSVNWAIVEARRLWPERYGAAEPSRDGQYDLPEGPRSLFVGDALTRALAAEALSGGGPASPDPKWAAPYLVEAFSDNYPIVRFFAASGLRPELWQLPAPDYLASAEARHASIDQWRRKFDAAALQEVGRLAEWLRARRTDVDLEVGE